MASAGRTLLPRFSRSIVMSFKARRRAMTSETFLWLSRAACRWRSFSSEDSLLVTTAKLHGAAQKWTGWWDTRSMRVISSLTDCIVVPLVIRPASRDCASRWTIGAGWHRRWSTRTQFEVSTTFSHRMKAFLNPCSCPRSKAQKMVRGTVAPE